jgi:pyruvate/2-oxoglutarate dehydrogenase complex dihydrolipoamide acyltransferase (E2) component
MKKNVIIPSTMDANGAKVIKWFVKNDDFIEKNQLLLEIESGNYIMQIESHFDGKVKIILEEGKIGFTNDVLCLIELSN